MARIRTIKPEFPQSESMGRVSREARLCFVLLWTLADDAGRLRGNSRMLASLLYPYDNDAPKRITVWMDELQHEKCIVQYSADGNAYVQICNWLMHQKIDRPSMSKIPAFDADSTSLAIPRDPSSGDQGSKDQGSKDQGSKDQGSKDRTKDARQMPASFQPTDAHHELALKLGVNLAEELPQFIDHHQSRGNRMKDWDAALRTWLRNAKKFAAATHKPAKDPRFAPNRDFSQVNYREGVDEDGNF